MKTMSVLYSLVTGLVLYLSMKSIFLLTKKNIDKHPWHIQERNENISLIGYENVRIFSDLCMAHGLPFFLVDPLILEKIASNSSVAGRCKYLCNKNIVTTIGILNERWREKGEFENNVRKFGFAVAYFLVKSLANLEENDNIETHYIFERNTHVIHLVIFYERDKSGIWWHGSVLDPRSISKGDVQRLTINKSQLLLGKTQGVFNRIETVELNIDGVPLQVPQNPLQFLQSIENSRFIECNHMQANKFYSKHKKNTSYEATTFSNNATLLIWQAKKALDELGIPFWLTYGTLLGWYRQCDIINYSRDVDIGIWIKDYDARLIPAMQRAGLPVEYLLGKESDSLQVKFMGNKIILDVFFFYEEDDAVWTGATQIKTGKKYKFTYQKFNLCWTEFLHMKIRIPCQIEMFINANYGSNWLEPVRKWDWKSSPPNAEENGEWSEEEKPNTIQRF